MKPVAVIGMGLSPEDLTGRHLQIIRAADILVGGKRLLDYFKDSTARKKTIDRNIAEAVDFIKDRMATRSIVVLASGDPLFFGIGSILINALGSDNVDIYPNISSIAAAFARIKEPWSKVRVVSLHGRKSESEVFKALDEVNVLAVLTDPSRNPAWIAKRLVEKNLVNFKICVLESLGTTDERFNWYHPARAAAMTFAEPNLVIIKRCPRDLQAKQAPHLGMPDDCYAHEKGLITKLEIRAITLAKLRLLPDHILWDLGAGSGSVSIEAALLLNQGKVFAVEKNPERIKQIEINKNRFGIANLEIVPAFVPDGLAQLPKPDRIFIGGGGKALKTIITSAVSYLIPDGRVVVNTVLMPNLQTATATLTALGFTTDVIQVQINRSRQMPWAERLEAQNPVWIVTGSRKAECGMSKKQKTEDLSANAAFCIPHSGFNNPVLFVGAGPGDPELITVKGQKALMEADVVVYAGSLVPEVLLKWTRAETNAINSASLNLEEIMTAIAAAHSAGKRVVRLHTGDPSLYGAVFEQMVELKKRGIAYKVIPGVTAAFAAAAALGIEYTLPEVSQTLILTRMAGRTPVPENEDLASLAGHQASMAIYLSMSMVDDVARILAGAYGEDAPCAVVYRASQPEEKLIVTRLKDLAAKVRVEKITKQALIVVGKALKVDADNLKYKSKLYDKKFKHGFRK